MYERYRNILSSPGWLAIVLVSVMGCSKPEPYRPILGKVLVKDKPASYAILTFYPIDEPLKDFLVSTTADENGDFELLANKPKDHAKTIEYNVTVSWRIPKNPNSRNDPEYGNELLPKKFLDPKASGVKVEIDSNATELEPIVLNP